jgi:dolichol-phosphate mannosyltransferase
MLKIYVIIPTYNEKENIARLVKEINSLVIKGLKILVIDDNSPDGTAAMVENMMNQYPVELTKRPGKLGLGSAYITGFKQALARGADLAITMDADFSHNPKKIPELIRAVIKEGYDLAIGSRRVPGGRVEGWNWQRKFYSAGAMWFSRLMLHLKTRDVTTGFRCYARHVLESLALDQIKTSGYSFLEELIYLCEQKKFKIKEVPIIFIDRQEGRSKLSRAEIIKFFITIFKLKFKTRKNE